MIEEALPLTNQFGEIAAEVIAHVVVLRMSVSDKSGSSTDEPSLRKFAGR